VVSGVGNNGKDGTEGACGRNALETYIQGPLLPKNPHVSDCLIAKVLRHRCGGRVEFTPMPDTWIEQARTVAKRRPRQTTTESNLPKSIMPESSLPRSNMPDRQTPKSTAAQRAPSQTEVPEIDTPKSNVPKTANPKSAKLKGRLVTLARVLAICIGAFLLLDAAYIGYVANFNIGQVVLAAFAIALILYGILWNRKKVTNWVHGMAIAACTGILTFSGSLGVYGSYDSVDYTEDAVIVLGAAVYGERVSLTLARRLDRAVDYHEQNPQALIVVSGGQGPEEDIAEALAMERYLIARGVRPERIIKEDRSTSTFENFLFSDALLKEEFSSWYTVAFITTDFHIYRASGIAEQAGISARHMSSASIWYAIPVNFMREMMAVVQFWIVSLKN